MMKRIALALALVALATGSMIAQECPHGAKPMMNSEAHKELMGQIKQFATNTILPQMTEWKGQLDKAMSPEDLQKLNELRARATSMRNEGMKTVKAMHDAWLAADYETVKAQRESLTKLFEQRKALFADLKPLAEKYRPTLETIGESAKPKVTEWKEQGKAIFEKWAADHKDELGQMKGMGHHGMMKGFGGMGFGPMMGHDSDQRRKVVAAYFMLWDGGNFIDEMQQLQGQGMDGLGNFNLE